MPPGKSRLRAPRPIRQMGNRACRQVLCHSQRFGNLRLRGRRRRACQPVPHHSRPQRFTGAEAETLLRDAIGRRCPPSERGSVRRPDSLHMVRPSAVDCRTRYHPLRQSAAPGTPAGTFQQAASHHSSSCNPFQPRCQRRQPAVETTRHDSRCRPLRTESRRIRAQSRSERTRHRPE